LTIFCKKSIFLFYFRVELHLNPQQQFSQAQKVICALYRNTSIPDTGVDNTRCNLLSIIRIVSLHWLPVVL